MAITYFGTGETRRSPNFRSLYRLKTPGEAGATQFRYELRDDGTLTDVGFEVAAKLLPKPKSGRIAVKVINHLGDEVMKVFSVRLGPRQTAQLPSL